MVFHKIITTGHQRLQPLFDCLLTIIVNVSPYLKTLSMVASTKLLHLLEAFSTPWFLYASPTNHHLVFFLLEVFNNIIQYQFDGNCNLVYTIIRKRNVFHQLANLPTDHSAIAKALTKRGKKFTHTAPDTKEPQTMEGAIPAAEAEPGTLKVSLAATPRIDKMTEKAAPDEGHRDPTLQELASSTGSHNPTPPSSPTSVAGSEVGSRPPLSRTSSAGNNWVATPDWKSMQTSFFSRNVDPPIWYDTNVKLFEIQRV
ncbi:hypothetical protein KUTeg_009232 [Tegillarca granosa]|uniref:Uncharacterized protein n=1 Tax=Tegillarca granosa TaxID=220873 RepID=A0ABQ9F9D2_TEGGR|nr:hypothetical protein KUTeg_009232 [Tegillarca granosa]